jgi:cytochrome c1
MTGPEHYAKAEQHLDHAASIETDGHDDSMSAWHQRQAQGHATLALAATQVDGAEFMRPADRHEWLKATDPDYAAEQAAEAGR